jgi:enterochelin esterase-like enzyme
LFSPRLAILQHELEGGNAAGLDAFWQEVGQQDSPLIEPISGDETHSLVTFLWRATDETQNVAVVSNLSGRMGASEAMTRMPATDLWHKTYKLPNDTRESYQFAVAGNNVTDPFNSRRHVFPGDPEIGFTGWESSVLELPAAPPQLWNVSRPGIPSGQVTLHRIRNDVLDNEYRVWAYTPPGYTADGPPYGWLLMFDGWFYVNLIPTPTIVDNLCADGLLPPLVAIMVGSPFEQHRRRDLACYPPFENFLMREVVPWARQNYHLSNDPAKMAVVGASLGGLMAAYVGLRHSDIFGNVLAQSAYFGWKPTEDDEDEWIVHQYVASPKMPLRFHIAAGLFETDQPTPLPGFKNLLVSARHMRDVLQEKGYPVHYAEFSGGHGPMNLLGTLANGLLALLGKDTRSKY